MLEGFDQKGQTVSTQVNVARAGRGALLQEGDSDYRLRDGWQSAWVAVNNVAIYIRRHEEGVSIDLYPDGDAARISPLTSVWLPFSEAGRGDE